MSEGGVISMKFRFVTDKRREVVKDISRCNCKYICYWHPFLLIKGAIRSSPCCLSLDFRKYFCNFIVGVLNYFLNGKKRESPVTVAALSKAWTVFAYTDTGIVGSIPAQGMDIWCVYAFILCLCCPVVR
jgi:hypothetical protein